MGANTPQRIRLLTYNIHGCIGTDGLYDSDRVIRVIRRIDADVVALQEVYDEAPADRQFIGKLQSLPYPYLQFGRTLLHEQRGPYGNLILSKWPLTDTELIDISYSDTEPRGAIRAKVLHPQRTLDLTATHLGLKRRERLAQVATLLKHWGDALVDVPSGHAFVLMGDLNEWIPRSSLIGSLNRTIGRTLAVPTFPSTHPLFALDHVLVNPYNAAPDRHVINTPLTRLASDHLPIVAEIRPKNKVV